MLAVTICTVLVVPYDSRGYWGQAANDVPLLRLLVYELEKRAWSTVAQTGRPPDPVGATIVGCVARLAHDGAAAPARDAVALREAPAAGAAAAVAPVRFYRPLVLRLVWLAMSLDHAGSGDWRPGDASSAVSSHAGASTTELLAELRAWAAEVDRSAPGARKAAAIQRQAVAAKARAATHHRPATPKSRHSRAATARRAAGRGRSRAGTDGAEYAPGRADRLRPGAGGCVDGRAASPR